MKRYLCLMAVLGLAALSGCGRAVPSISETQPTAEALTEAPPETASPETPSASVPETQIETMPTDTEPLAGTPVETALQAPPETAADTEEETVVHYENIRNPVVAGANDPWVVEHEGHYYYCRSFGKGVIVSEVPSLFELTNEGGKVVYTAPENTRYSSEYWAPELHYIDGAWYIYVAADDGNNDNHRMYVLKGTTQDPTDPFKMVGQITDRTDRWAIDGTVLQVKGQLYFVWSGWRGSTNVSQNLYIAHMSDPCTIDSERVMISAPTHPWECVGTPTVNEGPVALCHGDDTFIVYSASGSWTDSYCLGLLTLVGDDPMDPHAWIKSEEAVFSSRPGVAYGPGHCSFTTAVNGSVWMIYHANLESGTGWAGRSGWVAPVTFAEDGRPILGRPRRNLRFPIAVEPLHP